jgi:carboxylesterase type B
MKWTDEALSLYLDIWVPPNTTRWSSLPVKVWIYGGSNVAGSISDALYDGCNLAQDGTLLVSINYRLGPLGFMALESAGIGGNFGIQDILLGLRWIQSNIAAFGGDPVSFTSPQTPPNNSDIRYTEKSTPPWTIGRRH